MVNFCSPSPCDFIFRNLLQILHFCPVSCISFLVILVIVSLSEKLGLGFSFIWSNYPGKAIVIPVEEDTLPLLQGAKDRKRKRADQMA